MGTSDVFLSYNEADRDSVLIVQRLLESRGISTFLYQQNQIPGLPWPQALEEQLRSVRAVAVFVGRHTGGWQKKEIWFALARQTEEEKAGQIFPLIPVFLPNADRTPSFLLLHHGVDLSRDLADPAALDALDRAIHGVLPVDTLEAGMKVCPYRGLSAFREEDAVFFAGRETFAQSLLRATTNGGLVSLVGPSGSGKSSVVQAGLLPLLRQERPPHNTWDAVFFRPGDRPFHRLAAALVPFLEPNLSETDRLTEAQKLGDSLRSASLPLASVVERILEKSRGTDRLLVGADQSEELFTLTPESDRQKFVSALLEAQDRAPMTVLTTLRADFYGHAIAFSRELSDRIALGQVTLGAMTREELRRAVEEPARRAGLEFEIGLVDRMLDDVGNEPGKLPLLEFALQELWERRAGRLLKHSAYTEIGAVAGSIAKRAEEEFIKFSPQQQLAARRFLTTRLVRVARAEEGGDDTRLRTQLENLDPVDASIVRALADARLLVAGRDETIGKETAEVAHEALIRHWGRLRAWLNEDREFLLWRQRFSERAKEWKRAPDDALLLRGTLFQEAKTWLEKRAGEFTALEHEYVDESLALRRREERRRRRVRVMIGVGSVAALLVLVYFGATARLQSQHAATEAKIAFARQLATFADQARSETEGYLDRSALLAAESLRHAPLFEGVQAIRPAVTLLPHPAFTLRLGSPVNSIVYSPDGAYLAVGAQDKAIHMYDAQTGKELWKTVLSGGTFSKIVFSADGQYIATASGDQTARLLNAKTGNESARITNADPVEEIAVSPNGSYFASSSKGTVHVLGVGTHSEAARLDQAERVSTLAFSPDGRVLVIGGQDNLVRVYETTRWHLEAKLEHKSFVEQVIFNSDGSLLATRDFDKYARIFETRGWRKIAEYKARAGISSITFTQNGRYLAIGGRNDSIDFIQAQGGQTALELPVNAEVREIRFAHHSPLLAWSGDDNAVRVVGDVRIGEETERIVHTDAVTEIAVSPDDRYIASASADGTARVSKIENSRYIAALITESGGRPGRQQMGSAAPPVIESGAVSQDRNRVALVTSKGLDIFEVPSSQRLHHLDVEGNNEMEAVAFSPDGHTAGLADWENLRLFDLGEFQEKARLKQDNFAKAIAFSADGTYVGSGGGLGAKDISKGSAVVFEVSTRREVVRFSLPGSVTSIAFTADNKYVAIGCGDIIAAVLSASNRQLMHRMRESSPEHVVVIFDLKGKTEVAKIQHQSSISALSFSPDGKYLATGSADGTSRIIRTNGWKEMLRFVHQGAVRTLAFSRNSGYLASGSDDRSTRVIDTTSGLETTRLLYDGPVMALRFNADDRELVSLSGSRFQNVALIRTDLLRPDDLVDNVCARLTRNLTRSEWEQYLSAESYRKTCPNLPEGP